MRRYILTILLTIVFIGLLILVINLMKNNTKTETKKIIFESIKDNISSVKVSSVSSYTIEKKNLNYVLLAPTEIPSDKSKLDGIISSSSKIEYLSIVSEVSQDLAQFGLNNPKSIVAISTKDGKIKTILFGDNTPDNSGVYAKLGDKNTIYSVSSDVLSQFTQSIDNLIQKQILSSLDKNKLDKIDVLYKNVTYTFIKSNNVWKYNSTQIKNETSTEALNKYIGFSVDGISVKENYVNVNTTPVLKIIAYEGQNKVSTVSIIKKDDNTYNVINEGSSIQYYMLSSSYDTFIGNFASLLPEMQ